MMNKEFYSINNSRQRYYIQPEALAGKLEDARSLRIPELHELLDANPRIHEMLWFLQSVSMDPNGLKGLVEDLLNNFHDRFGSPSFIEACSSDKWPIPRPKLEKFWNENLYFLSDFVMEEYRKIVGDYDEVVSECFDDMVVMLGHSFIKALENLDLAKIKESLIQEARKELPELLQAMGVNPSVKIQGPWHCPDLINILFDYMDWHAKQESDKIAQTEVVSLAFDALDYAWEESKMVRISGSSRFGKTESVKAWCAMYPGRSRFLSVPSLDGLNDLLRQVAISLGIDHTYSTPPYTMSLN